MTAAKTKQTAWDGGDERARAALEWLLAGAIGSSIVYHIGDLAIDAPPRPTAHRAALRVAEAAGRMRVAAINGRVVLTQRRVDAHHYEYVARRVR
jgi:hypothetical protein